MGVSGTMARVAHPTESIEEDRIEEEMTRDRAALEAALMAATAREFGQAANDTAEAPAAAPARRAPPMPPTPFIGNVFFLVAVALGAMLASAARGSLGVHVSLGPEHERLFGSGPGMLGVLAVGGVLVGAGTRMSGGCTSGHGLSGCARLVPSSLVGTATFLGAAVVTSLGLAWWLG
jgi:uncharacterized membrane protein YedE/YeeE